MKINFRISTALLFGLLFCLFFSCSKKGNLNNSESNGTVTDIDGNLYHIVNIGKQFWMVENLKTTQYNDHSLIPLINDSSNFVKTASPAYCWFNDDISNKKTYGALYNWYTVNTDKLCPIGWHVPSVDDFSLLENYLIENGFNYDGTTSANKIAKALASSTWQYSTFGIGVIGNPDYQSYINKSGFTALPGGNLNYEGHFINIGQIGSWWTSTEAVSRSEYATYFYLSYDSDSIARSDFVKPDGHSVRCIKD